MYSQCFDSMQSCIQFITDINYCRFHEKLEHSGFEQPIARQFSPILPAKEESSQSLSPNHASTPPSGYPHQTENDGQRHIVLSRAQFEASQDDIRGNVNEKPVEYPASSAPVSLASYTDNPVYKYLSRMVAEKKLMYPTLAPEPRSTGAYMMLQNPTLMSQAMSRTQGSQEGIQNHLDLVKKMGEGGVGINEEGFIHIRPG